MLETQVKSLGQEDTLEKGLATHSSMLAWSIPWTEEPGELLSTGSQSQTQLSIHAQHSKIKVTTLRCGFGAGAHRKESPSLF